MRPDKPRTRPARPHPEAPQGLAAALPSFTPAQLRPRSTGWTPDRQRKFIEALAASACVTEAAASVGLSATAAGQLDAALARLDASANPAPADPLRLTGPDHGETGLAGEDGSAAAGD